MTKSAKDKSTQSQKFIKSAQEVEADEDEARWEERLRKVAKHKPKETDSTT
jgi:hypothetical protein